MLDEQSKIVAYDPVRGEPRMKGKRQPDDNAGDCVDCNQCVVVCPTGIDIRKGLQMECINCTQCIDACDDVMDRVGKPRGLIRYSSQDAIARKPRRLVRGRTIIYQSSCWVCCRDWPTPCRQSPALTHASSAARGLHLRASNVG
ncbi:MAG: 4Fe-4S dicluster domain-containing protein [Pirellulaceae bacterium]